MGSLHEAINNNDIARIKSLINSGVNLDERRREYDGFGGETAPLQQCICGKKFEIAKLLIEAGANTTSVVQGSTPLDAAISQGNLEMVKLLLDNGADLIMRKGLVNAIDRNKPEIEIIREFIKRGVNLSRPSACQKLPITCAIERRNFEILKLLVENGVDVNAINPNWTVDTPVIQSIRIGNVPAIKYLIANKADLNLKNTSRKTPLSLALSQNNFRMFKLLIDSGADPTLASEAVEAMAKQNADFAAYMSTVKNTQSKEGPTGHEAASN